MIKATQTQAESGEDNCTIMTPLRTAQAIATLGASSGYLVKTANYTAVAGDKIAADVTGGAFTITLPATPADGDSVEIVPARGTFAANNLTIGRNGESISGVAADYVLSTKGGFLFVYRTGYGWSVQTLTFYADDAGHTYIQAPAPYMAVYVGTANRFFDGAAVFDGGLTINTFAATPTVNLDGGGNAGFSSPSYNSGIINMTCLAGMKTQLTAEGAISLGQILTPSAPASNFANIYSKDVSGTAKMFVMDEAGNEVGVGPATTGINSITSATGQALTLATLDSNASINLTPHGTGTVITPATSATGPGLGISGDTGSGIGSIAGGRLSLWAGRTNVASLISNSLFPSGDNDRQLGLSNLRWSQLFIGPTGIKIGDGTNGPTITATGTSPNESLVLTPGGTGRTLVNNANTKFVLGEYSASLAELWLLPAATSPSSTNFFLVGGGTTNYINAETTLSVLINNSGHSDFTATKFGPQVDNTLDLGSSSVSWRNVYVGAAHAKAGGTIFDHYTDTATVSTDGTEDNLYSDTTAASTLGADGDSIVSTELVQAVGDVTKTHRIRKYFAGTVIYDSGTITNLAGATDYSLTATIIRESSTVVRCMVQAMTTSATATTPVTYTRITGLTLSGTNIIKTTGVAGGAGVAVGDIINKLEKIEWKSAD